MRAPHRWLMASLTACVLLLAGCTQTPGLGGGMFSPSGKYFAYIYQVTTINSYQRTGARTVSSGWFTTYLQVIDTDSGQKLLDKPLKRPCGYARIGDVSETSVLVTCMAAGSDTKNPPSPLIFDIGTRAIAVGSKTVAANNPPGLLAGLYSTYRNAQTAGIFIVEGADGRKYRLDPQTGKAFRVSGEFEPLPAGISGFYQGCSLPQGLQEDGDTRRYIQRGWKQGSLRSQDDFLDPEFLCIDAWTFSPSEEASDIDGGFLVLSCSRTDNQQHKLLTLVDRATLKTRWSTSLPQPRGDWAGNFRAEKFARRNGQLLVANASLLLRIDPKNGRIVQTTHLVDVN